MVVLGAVARILAHGIVLEAVRTIAAEAAALLSLTDPVRFVGKLGSPVAFAWLPHHLAQRNLLEFLKHVLVDRKIAILVRIDVFATKPPLDFMDDVRLVKGTTLLKPFFHPLGHFG